MTRSAYDEVYVYAMRRPGFFLQHVVDATAVQTATDETKPIAVVFGLVGLYLYPEKQFSGKQVQKAHMDLANKKKEWPKLRLPVDRGSIAADDVLTASPGPERDRAIEDWCRSVWKACAESPQEYAGKGDGHDFFVPTGCPRRPSPAREHIAAICDELTAVHGGRPSRSASL
jgi:hypothetical protein